MQGYNHWIHTEEWFIGGINHPKGSFYLTDKSKTYIHYLTNCDNKVKMGKGYWDDSPRFVWSDYWLAMIWKSMITAVNPEEDTYLNVREMMYLMRFSVDFEIDYKM